MMDIVVENSMGLKVGDEVYVFNADGQKEKKIVSHVSQEEGTITAIDPKVNQAKPKNRHERRALAVQQKSLQKQGFFLSTEQMAGLLK